MTDMESIIHQAMNSMTEQSPEIQLEYRISCILRELRDLPIKDRLTAIIFVLDELCAVTKEHNSDIDRYMAGQIITRSQLAASFLYERRPLHNVVVLR